MRLATWRRRWHHAGVDGRAARPAAGKLWISGAPKVFFCLLGIASRAEPSDEATAGLTDEKDLTFAEGVFHVGAQKFILLFAHFPPACAVQRFLLSA